MSASASAERKCANKGCGNTGKHLCSGCGEEIYCSKDCQKAHWASHKPACQSAVKPEAVAFLKSLESLSIKQLKNVMKAKAASFDGKKKTIVLKKLEAIVEKPNLVNFVSEYVQLSEVEALLSAANADPSLGSSSSNTGSKSKSSSSRGSSLNNNQPMPTPKQLREQAKMMREQPNAVRRANAMFQNMTDAQIRQYADQIEQAADDPAMMQEMSRMAKMSPRDRNQLQHIQEGLSGTKPMDLAWIDATVAALKSNPKIFKSMVKGKGAMMGGVTDEQTGSFIDTVSAMDAGTLKMILRFLVFLGSLYKPATELYAKIDSYTFGSARYLVLFLVMILAYYVSMIIWMVLKFLVVGIYALYGMVTGNATSGAATSTVETVFETAYPVSGAIGKAAANSGSAAAVGAAATAAGVAGATAAGANLASPSPSNTVESADDEF